MTPTKNLADVLGRVLDVRMRELHVAMPARVESYEASAQRVTVKPLLKSAVEQPDGTFREVGLPVISNVPVCFPGAGGFRVTFPVRKGDVVLLVFADSSLDAWKEKGGEVAAGEDVRSHQLPDAVAIPGLRPFSDALQDAPTDGASFGLDGGTQVHVTTSQLSLGEPNAAYAAALAEKVQAELEALRAFFVGVKGGPEVTALAAAFSAWLVTSSWPKPVGSTTVKVKG